MDINSVTNYVQENALAIFSTLSSFLLPLIGLWLKHSIRERNIQAAKKELTKILTKKLVEEPDTLDPETIYAIVNSKKREFKIPRSLVYKDIIEIFEDIQTEFVESIFIQKEQRVNLLRIIKEKMSNIKNYNKIDEGGSIPYLSFIRFFLFIISIVFGLIILYLFGTTLSEFTNINFPFSGTSILLILIGAIIGCAIVYIYVRGLYVSSEEVERKRQLPLLENVVDSALKNIFGEKNVEKNKVAFDSGWDFIADLEGKKIPIQIKFGHVETRDIRAFICNKEKLTKDEGIIITNGSLTNEAMDFAAKNKTIIFEKITNEDDLIEKLKYVFKS